MDFQQQMEEDAREAQRITRKFFVVGLDFSRAGLSDLDDAADNVDTFMRGGASDENIELLTRLWGAYLGEVLVRQGDAMWVAADNRHGAVVRLSDGQAVSPHDQVRSRITQGAEHRLTDYADRLLGPA